MSTMIETRRLRLRSHCASDAPAIALYLNNFAVAGKLSRVPYPYAVADAQWWLDRQTPDNPPEDRAFAIELDGAGYIGNVGFHEDINSPTLGYWLAEPFWHRGFMTEAAGAVIDWYFAGEYGKTIHSGAFAFNKASLAVQRKLGFTETGVSSRHCLARGEQVRHIDTQLSRSRWLGTATRVQEQWASGSPAERATAKDKS